MIFALPIGLMKLGTNLKCGGDDGIVPEGRNNRQRGFSVTYWEGVCAVSELIRMAM